MTERCAELHPDTNQRCVRVLPHEEHVTDHARDVYCLRWWTDAES